MICSYAMCHTFLYFFCRGVGSQSRIPNPLCRKMFYNRYSHLVGVTCRLPL